ncbi:MAG: nucleotidyltransferase family protein [Proteobacteria bacterium]|nr:nucleotidyltransferase family protein [Pseudomonadota bacterium]
MPADGGALILAAGQSKRYGGDKRYHPIDGQPMLLATINRYTEVFGQIIVVLRAQDHATADLLADIPFVHAEYADLGMGHSLACGAGAALTAQWRHAFVALADMPFVRAATLRLLNQTMTTERPAILQPVFNNTPGHPVGFSNRLFTRLQRLQGDEGARSVLAECADDCVRLNVEDPGVLTDVDTPS